MTFLETVTKKPFSLIVSLPLNRLDLAKAALEGGADAVKVHCNVWHRASGHTFGTFEENKPFLRDLVKLCGDIPAGLVPGADEAFISNEERLEAEDMGLGFFSSYIHHLPCYMMECKKLTKMVAIGHSFPHQLLDTVSSSGIEVLECSIQPGDAYGSPLNYSDILNYQYLASHVRQPTVIPTQKRILPGEVRHLYEAGCKAVMIGAIVMGKEPTYENVKASVATYREAIDAFKKS